MSDTNRKEIILVTGGCRSGKSAYAQDWAEQKALNRVYLATARVLDPEMADRVGRHQEVRGRGWTTVEEPLQVAKALKRVEKETEVILLDCLTLWLTNLLMEDFSDDRIFQEVDTLAAAIERLSVSTALVTNEVGWGIVPDNALARRFRDLAGSVNQKMASVADRVVLTVSGQPLVVKGR